MATLTAPVPSMAIPLQEAPGSRASAMSARSSTKKDLHAAGRRRLEQFKKNKREKASKQAPEIVAEEQAAPLEPADSNGDSYVSVLLPNQDQLSLAIPDAEPNHQDAAPNAAPAPATFANCDFDSSSFDSSSVSVDALRSNDDFVSVEPVSLIDRRPIAPPPSESEEHTAYKMETVRRDYSIPSSTSSVQGLFRSRDFSSTIKEPSPPRSSSSEALFRHRPALAEVTNGDTVSKTGSSTRYGTDDLRYDVHRTPAPFANDDPALTSSRKDDFAALEQHIEDLTQEKFSLQRGLDKAKALVETLTQANSALTEDYNQQGAKVNELKDELARYLLEFRSQEIVIKNLKSERDRAVQESNAAVERSRAFAAEVIVLEEKVLKTRSQELKSQKEVESLRAELESCRKQIQSIEKDRLNSNSLNEALQEEKKVLLSRMRELADRATYPTRSATTEEASTSTDDLVVESPSTPESVIAYPTSLPQDQLGIIESINALVTELGEEKDALLRLLRNETNAVARLKVENAELMQKLESQTQQLELAVAQSMARVAPMPSPGGASQQSNDEPEYVDEGDEVVDRVLGWIMRLFPGSGSSSSRRIGSKHL